MLSGSVANRNHPFFFLPLADDDHVRNLHILGTTNLGIHSVIGVIATDAQFRFLKLRDNALSVVVVDITDRNYLNLLGG